MRIPKSTRSLVWALTGTLISLLTQLHSAKVIAKQVRIRSAEVLCVSLHLEEKSVLFDQTNGSRPKLDKLGWWGAQDACR